jgi:hypothetical protein
MKLFEPPPLTQEAKALLISKLNAKVCAESKL